MLVKALILSFTLHSIIVIVAMVFPFAGNRPKHQDPIAVYLTTEERAADVAAVGNRKKESDRPRKQVFREEAPQPIVPSLPALPGFSRTREEEREASSADGGPALETTLAPKPFSVPSAGVQPGGPYGGADPGTGHRNGQGLNDSSGPTVSGDGNSAGRYDNASTSKPAVSSHDYVRERFAYIRALILKNLAYPPGARLMGEEGAMIVRFIVLENGFTQDIRIVESSGNNALDRAVVKTIQRIQPFPKPPARAELILPIAFKLE